ncbi:MAG: hypothetical protein EOP53_17500 [Sphingobacteriales bacterium]|nr:MAG: hypothetical protein EOP53_17500 [Sphingobacteriales bacterium]
MTGNPLLKAGILALMLTTIAVISWELYNRSKGFDISYDDGGPLWTNKRKMLNEPPANTTVFVGSSRIKFDLDAELWQKLTGTKAVQLSCVGSTPLPIFLDVAADEKFKGRMVVDVTEVLFFSDAPPNRMTPDENLKYFKEETPAQKAGFYVNEFLESNFVFLDKDRLSLNAKLAKLRIPNRPGVFEFPLFPDGFGRSKFTRQEYMTPQFLTDTNQINQVRGIWGFLAEMGKRQPPTAGAKLDSMLLVIKTAVDKIRARGGDVLFVRTPSTGPFWMGENMAYPREKYFDRLLQFTNSKGIHFLDYEATKNLPCPDFSHLSMADASLYTKELVRIMQAEKGWQFLKTTSAAN